MNLNSTIARLIQLRRHQHLRTFANEINFQSLGLGPNFLRRHNESSSWLEFTHTFPDHPHLVPIVLELNTMLLECVNEWDQRISSVI